jgi:hypothetical protein
MKGAFGNEGALLFLNSSSKARDRDSKTVSSHPRTHWLCCCAMEGRPAAMPS